MVLLNCKRCNNTWDYKGNAPYVTSCSKCKNTVFLSTRKVSEIEKNRF